MEHPRYSVSSSVYSPLDSEFDINIGKRKTREGTKFNADAFGSDYNSSETSGDELQSPKRSNQTLDSYFTAHESPSFTSINKSLLRTESGDPSFPDLNATPRLNEDDLQRNDETPMLNAYSEERPLIDETPKLASLEYREDPLEDAEKEEVALDKTFNRLSSTLKNTRYSATDESYRFHTNFSMNVKNANSTNAAANSRTSTYYKKIHSKPPEDNESYYTNDSNRNSYKSNEYCPSENNFHVASGFHRPRSPPQSPTSASKSITPSKKEFPSRQQSMNGGLNISFKDSDSSPNHTHNGDTTLDSDFSKTALESASTSYEKSAQDLDQDEDMSVLFIRALHPFVPDESEADNSVCLSFEKGDIAFVHTIEDSGWGEVTLIETLDRGWIPMNYFTMAVDTTNELGEDDTAHSLQYSRYLAPLLDSCGRFLSNPLSHTTKYGKITFSIKTINSVRDGVRFLLQETDCLSRSNEVVIKRQVVRKARKSLLSDWYTLMSKANEYKGTSNFDRIEILMLLVFQVVRKGTRFFEIWAQESNEIIRRKTEQRLQEDLNNYPLLSSPPMAKQRVTEINGVLYSYLALLIGRLDMIEHNSAGCEMLETVAHQIILLLRELLYISKTGSDYSLQKATDLDSSLDALLSLVSDLVTGVKCLVTSTTRESKNYEFLGSVQDNNNYSYTSEGKFLIQVASKMISAIGETIISVKTLFETVGDFRLSSERAYPEYSRMRIEPEEFIKKCSVGMVKSMSIKNMDLRTMKKQNPKSASRYSMFRSGSGVSGSMGITPTGVDILHKVMLTDDTSTSFGQDSEEFKRFMSDSKVENDNFTIKDELLVDANGNLLGASFKGLVYTLTNEVSPPEYFFISTFFMCFRRFANGFDLIEALIHRFDASHEHVKASELEDASLNVKLKNRRRLICKMFQIWMESYWSHEDDAQYLSTLVNFFNEGVFSYLPMEAMKLIEVASHLISRDVSLAHTQLKNRSITLAKYERKESSSFMKKRDSDASIESRYSMVDGYELTKINTNSSVASSLKSMTLPIPLGVSSQTTTANSLLTKGQLNTIENVVRTYREILGESWCPIGYIKSKHFTPIPLPRLLPNWYSLCEQSWVLTNYRPNLLDFNGLELAKQFTLIESEIFRSIQPEELLNGNFTAEKAHLKLASNVRLSLLFTNCLSDYVLESILQPQINHKIRVNIVKTWLKVAISCLYLRNFNSLAAIITSMQSHLITRLTKVWSDLSEKYTTLFEYLSGVIHPDKNYSVYRSKLKKFLLSNEYNIPVVPYFSLFLQDLTFVSDGNPNFRKANTFLNQKLINIDKYLKISRVIADIECLQIPYSEPEGKHRRGSLFSMNSSKATGEDYTIATVPALQELILLELWKISQQNKADEDRAWKLSCEIQPRDLSQQTL
ncbi:putative bud site selection protein [Clavispora lusitaniae]|uniref:Bud site selection protein n=1 Tax=Clavispora lusitaniae TaxID=36911 RepID=A0ACD0WDV4_CLALS|nr:putative bud site selection protein [Clavispora lusitaniae]QFZ31050.1 putative bud site selection protein [Clavispora lusitaniae]QFZ36718.1 putative bud site selection protein [Clavispora lusitaniae]QFZ42402.1 putative bud site selection protein [Clavispora lusitaniae]QFZ48078.1 putative bud site selection protein [Clavispora lusitaniae]